MGNRFFDPVFQALNDAGVAVTNGKLYFYEEGTTTLQDTFQDKDLTIPNTNPVVTGQGGRMPDIWLQSENYTVVYEIDDEEVWSAVVEGQSIPDATDTTKGVVELATAAEMAAGVDTERVPSVQIVTDFINIAASQVTSGVFDEGRLPSATEAQQGAAEIATQSEADAGTDDERIITALKMKNVIDAFDPLSDKDYDYTNGSVTIGDFIIKFGWVTTQEGVFADVTFATAFPNECFQVVGCPRWSIDPNRDDSGFGFFNVDAMGFRVISGNVNGVVYAWIAVGH